MKSIKLPFNFGGTATTNGLSKCGKGIICDEIDKIPVITCKNSIQANLGIINVSKGNTLAFDQNCKSNISGKLL